MSTTGEDGFGAVPSGSAARDAVPDGTVADGTGPTGAVPADDWRARRREAADAHEAVLLARRRAESDQARVLIRRFVEQAAERGVDPVPLRATGYGGRGRFRTPLVGWYLRRDESVAIASDGEFYVLTVPTSLSARLRGVTPQPQDPPLVIGAGGKDGESLDLPVALARALGEAS
ncbi:MAG TPA: hypothetical protein VGC57_12140 [Cellulomonas sp.]